VTPVLRARVLWHVLRLSIRADRRTVVALAVMMAAQAGLVAATGLSQRWLVDQASAGSPVGVVYAVVVGALAHGIRTAGGRVQGNMLLYLNDRVTVALSEEILHSTVSVPTMDHLEQRDYLDRLTRLRRGTWALASSFWQAVGAVMAIVSLLATVGLLAAVDLRLCLLAAFAVPPLLASRRSARITRQMWDACAELIRLEQKIHEMCLQPQAVKELVLSAAGGELDRRADVLWRAMASRETTTGLRAAAYELAGWCCYAAGFFGALWILAGRVREGAATLGDAVLVISLATQLQLQLRQVVQEVSQVAAAGDVVDHYRHLREYPQRQPRGDQTAPARLVHGIELRDVSFRYPGTSTDALHQVNLRLPAGGTVALVGANGAGKTTLVKLLTGMYTPTAGCITVDGQSLSSTDLRTWRTRLSAVFQDFARPQVRAWEAVGIGELGSLHRRAAIHDAVRRADADRVVTSLPHGLDTQLGTVFGGVEPSVGQWQKLALARALMRRTPLLTVLDEPTAALDPEAEHELFALFTKVVTAEAAARGAITLLVAHRLAMARTADQIVVIGDGRIVETGTHDALMASGGTYATLYQMQAAGYAEK
jgi:ATP-binding cassette subfamily B protein